MWLMWEGTKTGFYTKNNDGPLWLQWSAFEMMCYMNWSTCVLVPFLINFPHDSHANICGWNCLVWICHKSLGCIEVVSGTLVFLIHKIAPVPKYQAVKAFRWCGYKSLHILGHSISCRPVFIGTLQLFCPRECQHVTLARKLNGCRVILERVVMKERPAVLGMQL